jgi:hypothetical protein
MTDKKKNDYTQAQKIATICMGLGSLTVPPYLDTLNIEKKKLSPAGIKKELKNLTGYVTELMKIEAENKITNYNPEPIADLDKLMIGCTMENQYVDACENYNIGDLANNIEKSLNNIPDNLRDLPKEVNEIIKKAREYKTKYGLEARIKQRGPPEFLETYPKYNIYSNDTKTKNMETFKYDIKGDSNDKRTKED